MDIGQRIKEIAESKNISAKELADHIGRTRQAVYDIYRGKVSVNVELLSKICEKLNIEMPELFIPESDKLPNAEDLKKLIRMVFAYILERNYISIDHIVKLMTNIYLNINNGKGLARLELTENMNNDVYPFKEDYKTSKEKLSDKELKDFANSIFLRFNKVANQKEENQSCDAILEKTIDKYLDKEEGYRKMQEIMNLLA